jgi:hypothetical protein
VTVFKICVCTNCGNCGAGTYSVDAAPVCTNCGAGTYSDVLGIDSADERRYMRQLRPRDVLGGCGYGLHRAVAHRKAIPFAHSKAISSHHLGDPSCRRSHDHEREIAFVSPWFVARSCCNAAGPIPDPPARNASDERVYTITTGIQFGALCTI